MKIKVSLSYLRIVIIAMALGVLARIAGPQNSDASIQTNTAKLIEALVDTRAGLDIYRVHHKDELPPTSCHEDFSIALTTDKDGYGPYIKQIPVNPFNGLDEVRFDGEPAGANTAGWRLDTNTGTFQADNDPTYGAL
jgi:hypothetical protein